MIKSQNTDNIKLKYPLTYIRGLNFFVSCLFYKSIATSRVRQKPVAGRSWTVDDRAEAERQYRQRKMFHKWRVVVNPIEKDWYDLWEEAQAIRNIKNGLPPWHRDPPARPPRPQGIWKTIKWYFYWHWFNWEILWLSIILAPMFAVLLVM